MWLVSVAIRSNASVGRSILERICTPGPFRPGLPPKPCPMRAWPDEDEVDRSRRVGGSRSPRGILPPTHPLWRLTQGRPFWEFRTLETREPRRVMQSNRPCKCQAAQTRGKSRSTSTDSIDFCASSVAALHLSNREEITNESAVAANKDGRSEPELKGQEIQHQKRPPSFFGPLSIDFTVETTSCTKSLTLP